MKILRCLLLLFLWLQTAAAQGSGSAPMRVSIDIHQTAQTIRNFAASDAWSCQFVGNWPEQKKNQLADWLFSTDTTANGQPKGIGLSMWRFNIGAGSTRQGDSSGIKDEWRRAADWEKQAGQLWFLQAAKKRGVPQFLGFLNSPPVQFTSNGKAFASKGQCNINPDKYTAVADFLRAVITGVRKITGVTFNYISPVNEPQWDWSDGGQEGCPYNNEQIYGLTKKISETFTAAKLPTKILIAEAGKINYLYAKEDKPEKGMQINAFFDVHSPTYLGHLPAVYHGIAAHSYFTTSPADTAVAIRKRLAAALNGLEFWQSEYCILGGNEGEINGDKVDTGMDAALYMAHVIHHDLTVANAVAWQWWLAISPYNYKDGLIYIDKNKTDGSYQDTKMLWVLGNYSRFVRPGAQRVAVKITDGMEKKKVYISAFKNINHTLNIIIVNSDQTAVDINFDCAALQSGSIRSYTTSAKESLQPASVSSGRISIPARAVVTLTGNIQNK
ncbi:O-glycosyl hydrolase [Chitinophaga niastensis]|uniref:O-glycosyl hydrolase n=1 Tax=Chitinophaga niastensis TaxID=536980 RepID=A0A2P8HUL9_CHINA|nr:glycoside hydrolase [Chitinophaga niastensis]PSL49908.1 O-glycosyl hydrolase [Chitinophaga niastensis]